MDVHCGCGKFMGSILEGSKLRIGYAIICAECQTRNKEIKAACEMFKNGKNNSYKKDSFEDIFGGIFGDNLSRKK